MSAAPSEQQPPMERWMKPEEVAPLVNVKPSTVKTWARQGKIRSTKTPGGEIRLWSSDVAAMLALRDQPENASEPARCSNT